MVCFSVQIQNYQKDGDKMVGQVFIVFKVMWKYARSVFIGRFALIIISAALVSLNVIFLQKLIDNMMAFIKKEGSIHNILFSALIFGLVLLLDAVLVSADGFLEIICDKKLTNNFEPIIIKKFRNLAYFCYEDKDTQNTIQRMSGQPYTRIKTLFTQVLSMFQIIFTLIGLVAIYVQVSIWLVVSLLVFLVPMLWVNYKSSFHWWRLFEEQSLDERALNYLSGLLSTKTSLFELKVYRAINYIEKLWNEKSSNMLKQKSKVLLKVQRMLFIKSLFASLWYSASAMTMLICFLDNQITIGLFVSLINVSISVVDRISDLSGTFGSFSREIMEIRHYNNFMTLPEYEDGKGKPVSQPGEIIFDNVKFKYPNTDIEILKGVSFTVKPKANIAIVGVNGAGKSTIIKLLCKLYKPDSGRILVDGIDLQELSYQNIREIIGVLFQDYFTYELAIRENLAFGNIEKINDDDALIHALKKSKSYDIYNSANNGLDSNLGKLENDGIGLSGGQWQRLAIGRTCLSDASIIVLDEPTAALDPVAESEMYMLFFNVMKEKGTIMISHRLASSKMAEKIIVINDGVVAEEGTHEQLMSKNGIYRAMFDTQASWYITEEDNI
jgi:ATP-binding cassette, subfamily B, bacterial